MLRTIGAPPSASAASVPAGRYTVRIPLFGGHQTCDVLGRRRLLARRRRRHRTRRNSGVLVVLRLVGYLREKRHWHPHFWCGHECPNATLELNGGTLNLGGYKSTFGILDVNASSVYRFQRCQRLGPRYPQRRSDRRRRDPTINDWVNGIDYFYSIKNPGATTLGQITFTGFTGDATNWQSFDSEITPVPESATYGALMLGLSTLFAGWWHFRRRTS